MSLYADAAAGTLTPKGLQRYGPQYIDTYDNNRGPTYGLTPLIAAINGSHIKTVQLLLFHGADPDKPSRDNRTPLYWATSLPGSLHASKIVATLLSKNAEVDATNHDVKNVTPLMNAVSVLRDPAVASMLVDARASTTVKNSHNQTAGDIAESMRSSKLVRALRPSAERERSTEETMEMLVSFLVLVLTWMNSKVLDDVVQQVAKRMTDDEREDNSFAQVRSVGI